MQFRVLYWKLRGLRLVRVYVLILAVPLYERSIHQELCHKFYPNLQKVCYMFSVLHWILCY